MFMTCDDQEAPEEQEALEQVLEDVGPPVADMGKIVNGRAAGVEPTSPGLDRDEVLDLAAQGVVEPDHPAHISRSTPYPSTRSQGMSEQRRFPRTRGGQRRVEHQGSKVA